MSMENERRICIETDTLNFVYAMFRLERARFFSGDRFRVSKARTSVYHCMVESIEFHRICTVARLGRANIDIFRIVEHRHGTDRSRDKEVEYLVEDEMYTIE